MREQTRQVDQERWRLAQEESRLKALQSALEDERRITMEQLSSQRAEVSGQNPISSCNVNTDVFKYTRDVCKQSHQVGGYCLDELRNSKHRLLRSLDSEDEESSLAGCDLKTSRGCVLKKKLQGAQRFQTMRSKAPSIKLT